MFVVKETGDIFLRFFGARHPRFRSSIIPLLITISAGNEVFLYINMTTGSGKYEIVVGLEVHAQLLTKTKLFCGDEISFGDEPNTHVSAISLAHPGTLPKLNKQAVKYAVMLGLACGSEITRVNYFARKNYFYPDLPKGYQISQHTTPICVGGRVPVYTSEGKSYVNLNRIHLEEDAGKSLHDVHPDMTCIDYNRAGTALVEIVTEPEIHSSETAYSYLTELRKLVRYLGVCDGNMEEGSMRCDANISIRPKGSKKLGIKVEVKNLNSIRNVKRAIDFEAERLEKILEEGGEMIQETRSFDAERGITFSLRLKEEASDYRYFPDPDLAPFVVDEFWLEEIKTQLPLLPEQRKQQFQEVYGLSEYDAAWITEDKFIAGYFEQITGHTDNFKAAANWITGPVKAWMNESHATIEEFPLSAQKIAGLIALVDHNKISFSNASGRLFKALLNAPDEDPEALAAKLQLFQEGDESLIESWVEEVMKKMPDKVAAYKKGKKGLMGLFVAEVKKLSKGKADLKLTTTILEKKLES